MPVIQYLQLENELFCNIFYLRHLCDTQKFPDWPIKEPVSHVTCRLCDTVLYWYFDDYVKLLMDVLEAWKREVEKKPPEMSVDQTYDALGLETGVGG